MLGKGHGNLYLDPLPSYISMFDVICLNVEIQGHLESSANSEISQIQK